MARPKQFDLEAVTQEAMEAFWQNGYTATSVHDLLEEMGLNKGSLYGTFGDKKNLFLAVLDKYYEQRMAAVREILDGAKSPKRALRQLLENVADECTSADAGRGCLAAKAAMELAPHDKDVANWLRRFHRRNVAMLAGVIALGQEQGEIDRKIDAQAAARFVLNSIAGLRLMGTMSPAPAEVRQVVDLVLKALVNSPQR